MLHHDVFFQFFAVSVNSLRNRSYLSYPVAVSLLTYGMDFFRFLFVPVFVSRPPRTLGRALIYSAVQSKRGLQRLRLPTTLGERLCFSLVRPKPVSNTSHSDLGSIRQVFHRLRAIPTSRSFLSPVLIACWATSVDFLFEGAQRVRIAVPIHA